MTKENLYSIENFAGLQTDGRFVALLMYLRRNRPRVTQKEPHGMIQDSGRIDAYLDLIDKMEDVFRAPVKEGQVPRPAGPYQSAPPLEQKV